MDDMTRFGTALSAVIDGFVRLVIVPVTGVIPVLVRTGLLFAVFAVLWLGFLAALALDPSVLDAAWATVTALPLPLGALAWLLFLPLMAGLWIWSTDWPVVLRVVLILALAGWNLLVFLPRREASPTAVAR
jgi:hypothetical protein